MDTVVWLFLPMLFWAILMSLPLLASKKRNGRYHLSDVSLPILPSLCVFVGIVTLNQSAVDGVWAIVVYPILCSWICICILNARFFILERFFPTQPVTSTVILGIACTIAFIFGAMAPALHE